MDKETIIYSLNFEDVQTVAMQELGRELKDEELVLIEDKLTLDWYGAIHEVLIELGFPPAPDFYEEEEIKD